MPIVNGMGQSAATVPKQDALYAILRQHLAVVRGIFAKYRDGPQVYQYVDANAGCGYNELVDCDGSPLVFLKAVQEVTVPYYARFVEINAPNAMELRAKIGNGNHNEIIQADNRDVLPNVIKGFRLGSYGLLYTDPNGRPDFDLLSEVSRLPQMDKIDILIRYSATAQKRTIYQTGKHLEDYLAEINKNKWRICETDPKDGKQWTFLMGLNYGGIRDMKKLGFCYVDSARGQRILAKVNHTNEELASMRQPALFTAERA